MGETANIANIDRLSGNYLKMMEFVACHAIECSMIGHCKFMLSLATATRSQSQYSSGSWIVVALLSRSVITLILMPLVIE